MSLLWDVFGIRKVRDEYVADEGKIQRIMRKRESESPERSLTNAEWHRHPARCWKCQRRYECAKRLCRTHECDGCAAIRDEARRGR
jgi:hypothetical protein